MASTGNGVRCTALSDYQSAWLDWARGLAAVAVLVYHVRYRFFADWSEVGHTVGSRAFYTVTAFGHDAVMVFFVLSGLLISRSIFRAQAGGRWSWAQYMVARSTRLYLVLLPGLLLTLVWDWSGLALFPQHPIYTGQHQAWWHDFFDVRAQLGASVFVGNALFLQNVLVPPYGSNAPLWSLSFEFWFYLAFPLLWLALSSAERPLVRAAYLGAGCGLLMLLGPAIASYFPLWLLGAALWLLPRSSWIARRAVALTRVTGVIFAAALLTSHSMLSGTPLLFRDYLIAGAFAALTYVLLHDERTSGGRLMQRTGALLAGQSYTLYVVHVPLLVFCRAWLGSDTGQWHPETRTIIYAAGLTACALAYALVISRLTEAHTETCRAWVQKVLWARPAARPEAINEVVAAAATYSHAGDRTAGPLR